MKLTRTLSVLALALGASFVASQALAVPYASGVIRTGNTVTYTLNQNAANVEVLRDGGNAVYPGTNAGSYTFDMTGFTTFQIKVTGNDAPGWTQYVPDGTNTSFYVPVGVSINKNPASPNFGKVYISEGQGGTPTAGYRTTTSGIYMLGADASNKGWANGGVNWATAGNSSPFKSCIGPDDHLYVASFSEDLAYEFNDDMSVATQLIDASNKTASQYVEGIYVEGTQAGGDRKIYLVDSRYTDGRVGLIRYDLGSNAKAAADDIGTQVIGPDYFSYYPRDVARDSSGNWYMNQYRASANQAPAITKFNGSGTLPLGSADVLWETDIATYVYAYGIDLYEPLGWVAYGHYNTGEVYFFDMATGAFLEKFDAGSRMRELAFDAAGNVVTVDNSAEWARFWSRGGYTVATTTFDGTTTKFEVVRPSSTVTVAAGTGVAYEQGAVADQFTLTRVTDNLGAPLTVNFTIKGTASNGVDYVTITNQATFPANVSTVTINVTPIEESTPELTETVVLSLSSSSFYNVGTPGSATISILDNDPAQLRIRSASTTMFEPNPFDYVAVVLERAGDTNLSVNFDTANVVFGGTAVLNVDYMRSNQAVTLDPGVVTKSVAVVMPVDNTLIDGTRTLTVSLVPTTEYTVVSNTVTASIIDDDQPAETVLWSDTFTTDTSASYKILYGATNSENVDYTATFAYDYSAYSGGPIPPAPHSSGDTLGLRLTVNKSAFAGAAGLNLYPIGKSFSGNYALRFDMFLIQGTSGTTEYALFGINHSGTKTNWFRSAGVPAGWTFDGLFYDVEADGSALGDYVLYSGPYNTVSLNPTALTPGRNASTLTDVFKTPPWTAGAGYGGAPANSMSVTTPCWAQVEVRQVGNIVTLRINNTVIFGYTNTTAYTSGNIMIGYDDAYDSLGSPDASVIYDNVRVVRVGDIKISSMKLVGTKAQIDFTWDLNDEASAFVVQSAANVAGPYSDETGATISVVTPGQLYRALAPTSGSARFYRIRCK